MPELTFRCSGRRVGVLAVAATAPERRVTNDDLAPLLGTSDSWIRQRTGIIERRVASEGQLTSELAFPAAQEALAGAGISPGDLGMILFGTSSPDQNFPAAACRLQHMLGAVDCLCVDILAACTSWLYSASIAERFISSGAARYALVVGAEVMSRILDYSDRSSCILFGDGAAAAVLGETAGLGFESFALGADGRRSQLVYHGPEGDDGRHLLRMNGPETFKVAPKTMEAAARAACHAAGIELTEIDHVIPHQANSRIVEALARRLDLPLERFLTNLGMFGNTSAASIPMVLSQAAAEGAVAEGDRLLLVGFGAGLTWGATVLTWGQ